MDILRDMMLAQEKLSVVVKWIRRISKINLQTLKGVFIWANCLFVISKNRNAILKIKARGWGNRPTLVFLTTDSKTIYIYLDRNAHRNITRYFLPYWIFKFINLAIFLSIAIYIPIYFLIYDCAFSPPQKWFFVFVNPWRWIDDDGNQVLCG